LRMIKVMMRMLPWLCLSLAACPKPAHRMPRSGHLYVCVQVTIDCYHRKRTEDAQFQSHLSHYKAFSDKPFEWFLKFSFERFAMGPHQALYRITCLSGRGWTPGYQRPF
jgi:hypothetical protein